MMRYQFADTLLAQILFWREVSAGRAGLRAMSDEMLKDIGISRTEAVREANRHFWDTAPVEGGAHQATPRVELKLKYN